MTKQETLRRVEEGMKKNDCLVAKEIMENMEKFGISPSIAINGQVRKLCLIKDIKSRIIGTSEVEDFVSELKNTGYSEDDFWFTEYNQIEHKAGDFYAMFGKLIIVAKKSGKQKEYLTGDGTRWVADFAVDLHNGFYQE
jgi:hypothetical protein